MFVCCINREKKGHTLFFPCGHLNQILEQLNSIIQYSPYMIINAFGFQVVAFKKFGIDFTVIISSIGYDGCGNE